MKHTTKQSGRSRSKALAQRAAQLGCGISLLAVSAMLARPARAAPDTAEVLLNRVPADSSTSGFATSGSKQTNTQVLVTALLNDVSGNSTVNHTATGSAPGTAVVTGNELAAFATGSGQTNTVDLANIGTSDSATGISVLADQLNTYSNPSEDHYYPTTVNATITNSALLNSTTNAVDGDSLSNSSNLIESQGTGNVANSSVNGVVPINYGQPEAGTATLQDAGGPGMSGSAEGNVVVATSQFNEALDGGDGSFVSNGSDQVGILATSSGEYPQSVSVSTTESGNAISSVFLGNSATNDIGVSLTSGGITGAPSFAGALVVANQQAGSQAGFGGSFDGFGAYVNDSNIYTDIQSRDSPTVTLMDGAVTEDNNVVSATATGNSAVGAAGGPGNEISLGINLAGDTSAIDSGNTINPTGTIITGGDLLLTNQQYQGGSSEVGAGIDYTGIDSNIDNLVGSSVQLENDSFNAAALVNNAANAIQTAAGAGINLISGLTALTSEQNAASPFYAFVQYAGVGIDAGILSGTLSITNSTATLTDDKVTTSAGGNQASNSVALSASTIDAGAEGAATGPAVAGSAPPVGALANAGISLNNAQFSGGGSAVQYDTGVSTYLLGDTISNSAAVVTNPVLTSEATGNSATNSISANGSQGVSGSAALLNTQLQINGPAGFLDESDDHFGNVAGIDIQTLGEDSDAGVAGTSAMLAGSELYAEGTGNNASNTLDAMGGTLSNAGAAYGTLGLGVQLGTSEQVGAEAISDLALVNSQNDFGLSAYAFNQYSQAYVIADSTDGTISGSSFTVSGPANNAPTEQALAIGNEAMNALSALASTALTDTAGVVNAQANSAGSLAILEYNYVYAALNSNFTEAYFGSYNDGGNISDTSITVGTGATGGSNANILRALAYGNQASNELSVSAGTVNPDATASSFSVDGSVLSDDLPFDSDLFEGYGVGAAYGLLSDQIAAGTITAEGLYYNQIGIDMGNTVTNPGLLDVTASLDGNALVASAFANQASNSATVAANNLSATTYYPAADVTNVQINEGTVTASLAETIGSENPVLYVQLLGDGTVQDSALDITGNTVLTQAEGNDATNSLDTTGGNISDAVPGNLGAVTGGLFGNNYDSVDPLAFSVQNDQYGANASPIAVDQTGADALLSTGGDVTLSTLGAISNAFEATGYGNNATSSLSFGGTSTPVDLLDTSAGLQSTQYQDSDVNVTLGSPGVAAVAAGSDTDIPELQYTAAAGTSSAEVINGDEIDITGEPLTFHVGALTTTELADFEGLFDGSTYYDAVTNTFTLEVGDHSLSDSNLFTESNGYLYVESGSGQTGQYTNTDTIPGTPAVAAVPPSPSVLITVAGNIGDSTLDVSKNAFDATAIANNAVNTQNIAATTVNAGGNLNVNPGALVEGNQTKAYAAYALTNNQSFDDSITATVYGEAGINPTNDSTITSSTLIASDNTQFAEAEANVASNTLTLSATNTSGSPPTLALVSSQSTDGIGLAATAGTIINGSVFGLIVTAPGAITDSTLTMDGNSSEALAVANNATNLLAADATNLADESDAGYADAYFNGTEGTDAEPLGDYTLTNVQDASMDQGINATDVTDFVNSDSTSASTTGLVDSTADISGNTTSAFAEANAASNTLDLTSANSAATGALTNGQINDAGVTADGAAHGQFILNGSEDPDAAAATDSAINVSSNSTLVQGIGNQATNALNADTGATYGPQDYGSTSGTTAQATYAVLNNQTNYGPVGAYGTSTYGTELNGGGSNAPVSNTTVTVSYNTVDVKAFGNSATNTATVSALNSGNATVAVDNVQTNEANISATAEYSQIGSTIGGPGASGSTVNVGDNSIVASAIGNVATNAIMSH